MGAQGVLLLQRRRRARGHTLRELEDRVLGAREEGTMQIWPSRYLPASARRCSTCASDPYERADITSNTYNDWIFTVFGRGGAGPGGSVRRDVPEFPPRQKPSSFSVDEIMEFSQAAAGRLTIVAHVKQRCAGRRAICRPAQRGIPQTPGGLPCRRSIKSWFGSLSACGREPRGADHHLGPQGFRASAESGCRPCRRAYRRFHLPHARAAARARQIRDLAARCCGRRRRIAARAHGRLVLAAVQGIAVNFKG